MGLTAVQAALWALMLLTAGRFDYAPVSGTIDVVSSDGRSVTVGQSAVQLRSDGRCVMYVPVGRDGLDRSAEAVRLHEYAHILDCLDNKALDGSPLPAGANLEIVPKIPGCQRNDAERFACWYVANIEAAAEIDH